MVLVSFVTWVVGPGQGPPPRPVSDRSRVTAVQKEVCREAFVWRTAFSQVDGAKGRGRRRLWRL